MGYFFFGFLILLIALVATSRTKLDDNFLQCGGFTISQNNRNQFAFLGRISLPSSVEPLSDGYQQQAKGGKLEPYLPRLFEVFSRRYRMKEKHL